MVDFCTDVIKSTALCQGEISQHEWIDTKFGADIHGSQRMSLNDFSPGATIRLTFVILIEMSQQLLDMDTPPSHPPSDKF